MSEKDFLVISEEELNAIQNLSLSEACSRKVAVQLLNLSQYNHEDIYIMLDSIVAPGYLLCESHRKLSKDLPQQMQLPGYYFGPGLMIVLGGAELDWDGLLVSSIFDNTESGKVVKYGLVLILLAGCHH